MLACTHCNASMERKDLWDQLLERLRLVRWNKLDQWVAGNTVYKEICEAKNFIESASKVYYKEDFISSSS
jgi:hypothetical protein